MAGGNNRHVAIAAGSIAVLLGALDTYVVVTIMTDMMKDPPDGIGIPINKIQQVTPVVTWYLLGYIAAMPLLGRASDRFGRKLVLPLGMPAPTVAPTLQVNVNPAADTAVSYTDNGDEFATSWIGAGILPGNREAGQDNANGNPAPCYRILELGTPVWMYRDFGVADKTSIEFQSDFFFEPGTGNWQCGFAIDNDNAGSGARVQVGTNGTTAIFQIGTGVLWDTDWIASSRTTIALNASIWYTMKVTTTRNTDGTTTLTATIFNGVTQVAQMTAHQSWVKGGYFGLTAHLTTDPQATRYDNIIVSGSGSVSPDVPINTATSYVYTFKGANDWESAPSPASKTILRPDGTSVTVTTPTSHGYSSDYGIDTKVIYRSVSGASGDVFLLVDEIPLAQADYIDTLDDSVISTPGTPLATLDFDLPDPDMEGVIPLPNGAMAGFVRNQLCFSEIGYPYAWPIKYRLPTDTKIVAIRNIDNTIIIGTEAFVYTASGNDPATYSMSQPGEAQACVSKRGMTYVDGYGVVFPSPDGFQVCAGSAGNVRNATELIFTKQQWEALNPSSIIATVYDGVLFFWFDGSTPDSGYALDTKQSGFGLIRLSHHVTAAYVDPLTDSLYEVMDVNSEPVEALLPVASTAPTITALTIFKFDAHATNRIRYQWRGKLHLLPFPGTMHFARVDAEDFTNLVLRIYGDGTLIDARRVTSNRAFRIHTEGAAYDSYEAELVGTSRARTLQVSQTVAEMN